MFICAQTTYSIETPLDIQNGITSLVLFPLPSPLQQIKDISAGLIGASIGSVELAEKNKLIQRIGGHSILSQGIMHVTTSTSLTNDDGDGDGQNISSLLRTPVESEIESRASINNEDKVASLMDLDGFEKSYELGKLKTIYKLRPETKYMAYQLYSSSPFEYPPSPPDGVEIPIDSLYANIHVHPNASKCVVQFWVYSGEGEGRWQSVLHGHSKKFGLLTLYIQLSQAGPSWVRTVKL